MHRLKQLPLLWFIIKSVGYLKVFTALWKWDSVPKFTIMYKHMHIYCRNIVFCSSLELFLFNLVFYPFGGGPCTLAVYLGVTLKKSWGQLLPGISVPAVQNIMLNLVQHQNTTESHLLSFCATKLITWGKICSNHSRLKKVEPPPHEGGTASGTALNWPLHHLIS